MSLQNIDLQNDSWRLLWIILQKRSLTVRLVGQINAVSYTNYLKSGKYLLILYSIKEVRYLTKYCYYFIRNSPKRLTDNHIKNYGNMVYNLFTFCLKLSHERRCAIRPSLSNVYRLPLMSLRSPAPDSCRVSERNRVIIP